MQVFCKIKIMGIYKNEIEDMRKNIGNMIGCKIKVKEVQGRKVKFEEKEGIIQDVYKDYFMVKYDEFDRICSYNYTELFMKNVQISAYNGDVCEPIFVPNVSDRRARMHRLPMKRNDIVHIQNDISSGIA